MREMGYYSRITGEMEFSRPLTRVEIKAVEPALQDPDGWVYYKLAIDTETRETDEGTLTVIRAYGIQLITEDSVKAYDWERKLQEVISVLPGHVTVTGYFERKGEEGPDMERLYVKGRKVVAVQARIVWTLP